MRIAEVSLSTEGGGEREKIEHESRDLFLGRTSFHCGKEINVLNPPSFNTGKNMCVRVCSMQCESERRGLGFFTAHPPPPPESGGSSSTADSAYAETPKKLLAVNLT